MTPVTDTYLSLLRSGIWQTTPEEADGQLVMAAFELAHAQRTSGLVMDAWTRSQGVHEAAPEIIARVRKRLLGITSGHIRQCRVLKAIAGALSAEGIAGVLLKGEGLSALYANPMLRQTGDIDLWVGQEAFERAMSCLLPLSQKVLEEDEEEQQKHKALKIGGVTVEVHALSGHAFTRGKDRIYQSYARQGLQGRLDSVQMLGLELDIPDPTFNVFYVFHHLFCHFMQGGVGMRQVSDWAVLLSARKDAVDWDRLGKMVSDMGLERPWKVFLTLCVRYLGLKADFPLTGSESLDRQASKVLDLILREGNFGLSIKHAQRSGRYLQDKALSLWEHVQRNLVLFHMFPIQTLESFSQVFSRSMRGVGRDLAGRLGLHRAA